MELSGHGSTIDREVYSPSSSGAAFDLRTGFPTIPSLSSSNIAPIRRKSSDRQSGVLKISITQPKTKLETRLDAMLQRNQFSLLVERFRNSHSIKVPVINFKALSIGDGDNSWNSDSSYDLSRIIFRTLGNGIR